MVSLKRSVQRRHHGRQDDKGSDCVTYVLGSFAFIHLTSDDVKVYLLSTKRSNQRHNVKNGNTFAPLVQQSLLEYHVGT